MFHPERIELTHLSAGNAFTQLSTFGISRVGELTGLDQIGVPVWFATRPNSRTLSVANGKGLSWQQARLSAIMEAVEAATCENAKRIVSKFCSCTELISQGLRPVASNECVRIRSDTFDFDKKRAWVEGKSLFSNKIIYAPYELIGMDYRQNTIWDHSAMAMSSSGLGAGFDYDRALSHALLECVEDDAIAANDLALNTPENKNLRGIDKKLDKLILACEGASLTVEFQQIPSRTGIYTLRSRIFEIDTVASKNTGVGYGTSICAVKAATNSILEAIQSRLTNISGARDDIKPSDFNRVALPTGSIENRSEGSRFDIALSRLPDRESLVSISDALTASGLPEVFHFPLETGVGGVFVSRVIVPGLSSCFGDEVQIAAASVREMGVSPRER